MKQGAEASLGHTNTNDVCATFAQETQVPP